MWLYLAALAAVFLGLFDVCRKRAVLNNPAASTVFCTTVISFLAASLLALGAWWWPAAATSFGLGIQAPGGWAQIFFLGHGVILTFAWLAATLAVKHLPISIVTPIRASGPVWTLLGGILLFQESFSARQWLGLAVILSAYFYFCLQGKRDGIRWHRNWWVAAAALATMLNCASGLLDKYVFQYVRLANGETITPFTMLFWGLLYLSAGSGLMAYCGWRRQPAGSRFWPRWHWSLLAVGLALVATDVIYYQALTDPAAKIGLVAALRRSGAVVSFTLGVWWFNEKNTSRKALALAGVLAGVFIILLNRE